MGLLLIFLPFGISIPMYFGSHKWIAEAQNEAQNWFQWAIKSTPTTQNLGFTAASDLRVLGETELF